MMMEIFPDLAKNSQRALCMPSWYHESKQCPNLLAIVQQIQRMPTHCKTGPEKTQRTILPKGIYVLGEEIKQAHTTSHNTGSWQFGGKLLPPLGRGNGRGRGNRKGKHQGMRALELGLEGKTKFER